MELCLFFCSLSLAPFVYSLCTLMCLIVALSVHFHSYIGQNNNSFFVIRLTNE